MHGIGYPGATNKLVRSVSEPPFERAAVQRGDVVGEAALVSDGHSEFEAAPDAAASATNTSWAGSVYSAVLASKPSDMVRRI